MFPTDIVWAAVILFAWLVLLFFISSTVVRLLLPNTRLTVRWLLSILYSAVVLQCIFQVLALLHVFNAVAVTVVLGLLGVGLNIFLASENPLLLLKRDFRTLCRLYQRVGSSSWCPLHLFPAFVFFSTAAYATFFQTYSLDAANYHAFKAGMWVQNSGHFTFDAPGWWSTYQLFPGVGSVTLAFFYLPLHGSAFGILADLFRYLALWCVIDVLLWQFRVKGRFRISVCTFLLALPAVQAGVGSHNVDIEGAVYILTAIICVGLRIPRCPQLITIGLALGLALGTKHIYLPVVGLFGIAFFLGTRKPWAALCKEGICLVLPALLLCGPWYLRSYVLSGFPLSPLDLKIGPIRLGKAALDLSTSISQGGSFTLHDELASLLGLFRLPLVLGPSLTIIPLVVSPFLLLVLQRLVKQRNQTAIVGVAASLGFVVFYFHPSMRMVRVLCFWENGRFFIAPVVFGICVLFSGPTLARNLKEILSVALLLLGMIQLFAPLFYRDYWIQQVCALFLGLFTTLVCYRYGRQNFGATGLIGVFLLLLLIGLWRDRSFVNEMTCFGTSALPVPYRRLVHLLVSSQDSQRIAYVAKPNPLDNWNPRFPWLGHRFQNQLFYIPISEDGSIQPFYSDAGVGREGSYERWRYRLLSEHIDYVVSNLDGSVESVWMENHSCAFRLVARESFLQGSGSVFQVVQGVDYSCGHD